MSVRALWPTLMKYTSLNLFYFTCNILCTCVLLSLRIIRQEFVLFSSLEFGLACHLGVLLDVPCVGVAKKLFQVDGLEKDANHQEKVL